MSMPSRTAPTAETPSHRLFLALLPPEAPVREIAPIRDWFAPRRPVPDPQLHLTLLPFPVYPNFPDSLAARLVAALSSIEMRSFRVIVDRLIVAKGQGLLNPSEAVLGLQSCRRTLAAALLEEGVQPMKGKRFSPHVTLFYDDRPDLAEAVDPISWTAEEIVLVHSLVGRSEHRTLARQPLQTGR